MRLELVSSGVADRDVAPLVPMEARDAQETDFSEKSGRKGAGPPCGFRGEEISTISKLWQFASNIGAADEAGTLIQIPRCSGLMSPSVFGNMGLAFSEKVQVALMTQGFSTCVNMVARVNLGLAFGPDNGMLPSHWGVAAKPGVLHGKRADVDETLNTIEVKARAELASFQGRYVGFVGMEWSEFRDYTISLEKQILPRLAFKLFTEAGEWTDSPAHPEWGEKYQRLGMSGEKSAWGVRDLKRNWEKCLSKKQWDELWLVASCCLRDFWTQIYGDIQAKHTNLGISVGMLEKKSEALARELASAQAAAGAGAGR